MSDADRARWDDRYVAAGPVPAPPEALDDHPVPCGRALDVACGTGGTAVWLAQRGLEVDAVDVSAAGLAAGSALARRCGVQVHWWVHDLDGGLPDGCAGPYDLVVCQRFRDAALYPVLVDALAPGGLLAITVLSSVGTEAGPYRAAPGELAAAFAVLETLAHVEADGRASLLGRQITRSRGCARGGARLSKT